MKSEGDLASLNKVLHELNVRFAKGKNIGQTALEKSRQDVVVKLNDWWNRRPFGHPRPAENGDGNTTAMERIGAQSPNAELEIKRLEAELTATKEALRLVQHAGRKKK